PALPPAGAGAAGKALRAAKIKVVPPAGGGAPAGAPAVVFAVPAGGFMPANHTGITVRDDKGNLLPAPGNMVFPGGPGANGHYRLVTTPPRGQGKVTDLVFVGRRNVAISIPFTLADVRLP